MNGKLINNDVNKILHQRVVTFEIEKILLEYGKEYHNRVLILLEIDYKCKLDDCFANPVYLKKTLQKAFGDFYKIILTTIITTLKKHTPNKCYSEFLNGLSCENE